MQQAGPSPLRQVPPSEAEIASEIGRAQFELVTIHLFDAAIAADPLVTLARGMAEAKQLLMLHILLEQPQPSFQASVAQALEIVAPQTSPRLLRSAPTSVALKPDPAGPARLYDTAGFLRLLLRLRGGDRVAASISLWQLYDPGFVEACGHGLVAGMAPDDLPTAPRHFTKPPPPSRSMPAAMAGYSTAVLRRTRMPLMHWLRRAWLSSLFRLVQR